MNNLKEWDRARERWDELMEEPVTLAHVQECVGLVKTMGEVCKDYEIAHAWEDNLREGVLMAVVNDEPEAKEMAIEALKTSSFQFARWCA